MKLLVHKLSRNWKENLKVFDPSKIVATVDHNVPTLNQHLPIKDELSKNQVEKLKLNCLEHDIDLFGLGNPNQGIVHVIGPELGITQPGMTIVCGDSHTSTHGALGNSFWNRNKSGCTSSGESMSIT